MKKMATWALTIASIVILIDWGVKGIKLLDGDYNITLEAYIGLVCWGVILVSSICRVCGNKCPYCGKVRLTNGSYCSYCGKKID